MAVAVPRRYPGTCELYVWESPGVLCRNRIEYVEINHLFAYGKDPIILKICNTCAEHIRRLCRENADARAHIKLVPIDEYVTP